MPEIRTELEIEAPASFLWEVLADFPRYPEWNTFLIRLNGEPKVGAPLDVKVKSQLITITFHTTVLVVSPERELRWKGNFLHDQVVAAQHYFQIERLSPSRCRLIHNERFTGVLAPLAFAVVARSSRRGFKVMNQAFKERVEALVANEARHASSSAARA